MSYNTGKKHNQYPKGDSEKSSDQKIQSRQAGWRAWGEKVKLLKEIHQEPSVILGIKRIRQQYGDEPLDNS